jgi:hypothetical protein
MLVEVGLRGSLRSVNEPKGSTNLVTLQKSADSPQSSEGVHLRIDRSGDEPICREVHVSYLLLGCCCECLDAGQHTQETRGNNGVWTYNFAHID